MAKTFKQFVYAPTQDAWTKYTSKNDGDVHFIAGMDTTDEDCPTGSGIYAYGKFFPTPHPADKIYTKTEVDDKITTVNNKFSSYIPTSQKGANNGVAALDSTGKVNTSVLPTTVVQTDSSTGKIPTSVLPSYVDDVKEVQAFDAFTTQGATTQKVTSSSQIYFNTTNGNFVASIGSAFYSGWESDDVTLTEEAYGTISNSKVIPSKDKIYVRLSDNRIYRWSGSAMSEISGCALSDTQATTLLNEYVRTIEADGDPVTPAGQTTNVLSSIISKTDSDSKSGATYTIGVSSVPTQAYVENLAMPSLSKSGNYLTGITLTAGSATKKATASAATASFQALTITNTATSTSKTYKPNSAVTITAEDVVGWLELS